MSSLLELAERCEQATGADRALDGEIGRITGAWRTWPSFKSFAPTASIDVALTLVSGEGAYPQISKSAPKEWKVNIGFGNRAKGVNGKAATPALALCAAALRATTA